MQKVAQTSENMENENLQKLRGVFPQFVKDGVIDFDALRAFFDSEGTLEGTEKYGLNWAGKSNAFRAIRTPSEGTLTPQIEESKNWDKTENIFIEGDNLEVLKLLQKHYREQTKMIYIDPPYNTGKDFIYTDNFTENKNDYYERTGQSCDGIKLTSNPESNGRYHSDWLTMMYPRLFLARNLLKEDGVIFVSIDDHEVANLRMIMDEIFGEENFIADILWNSTKSVTNTALISVAHTHNLVYAKTIAYWTENREEFRLPETGHGFTNPDNDSRGPWKADPFQVGGWRPNQQYEIKNPKTGEVYTPNPESSWKNDYEKFQELTADNRIVFGTTGEAGPQRKRFLSEALGRGRVSTTLWDDIETTANGTKTVKDLFGGSYFTNPKPISLIKRFAQLSTKKDDTILDFFAGSGTTAHAVMDLNVEDGGNRKWICVQIPEGTHEESEACKAGYLNIAQISRERIRRAGEKIIKGAGDLDIGFKSFVLSRSNYTEWNTLTEKDDIETLKKQTKLFIEQPLVKGFSEQSVVYEILLKEGFDLNAKVAQEKGDLSPWIIAMGDKKLIITFAKKVTKDQVDSLALTPPDTFVCLDSALDDTTKVNIMRNLTVRVI